MHVETLNRARTKNFTVRLLNDVARQNGLDFGIASEKVGLNLESILSGSDEIDAALQIGFDRCFSSLTRDQRELWFALGLRMRLPFYGVLGLALLTAPTMRHVFDLLPYSNHLHMSLMQMTAVMEGDVPILHYAMGHVPPELHDYMMLRELGATITAHSELWAGRAPIDRIEIGSGSLFDPLSNCGYRIVHGCKETRIVFEAGIIDQPLFHGDPMMHAHYAGECRHQVEMLRAQKSEIDSILTRLLDAAIASDTTPPALPDLARAMGMTERTIQRRFSAEGRTFREAIDIARRKIAMAMLADRARSISDIAAQLGYAEPSSFYNACKRWTGLGPREYRAKASNLRH